MCQGTLHHLIATSERPGPPPCSTRPARGSCHCHQWSPPLSHPSPRRGQAQLLPTTLGTCTSTGGLVPAGWDLVEGVVWPQGQPLCHLRQGWATPAHPRLSEPTREVPLPLCHPRSQHSLGHTHPITRRPGKPKAPAAPAAPTSPGRGPAQREWRATPGTAGVRRVRSRTAGSRTVPGAVERCQEFYTGSGGKQPAGAAAGARGFVPWSSPGSKQCSSAKSFAVAPVATPLPLQASLGTQRT